MRRAVGAVLVAIGAIALTGCQAGGDSGPVTITSAHWEQYQAIEGFDTEPGDVTDAAELARLAEIIEEHDLQGRDQELGEGCPGGRSSDLTYVTDAGDEYRIEVLGCDSGEAGEAIDDLVSGWREAR